MEEAGGPTWFKGRGVAWIRTVSSEYSTRSRVNDIAWTYPSSLLGGGYEISRWRGPSRRPKKRDKMPKVDISRE